ncbi:hypothetical protein U3516DRAFT_773201 [Neocallimastix sp. 'constans']
MYLIKILLILTLSANTIFPSPSHWNNDFNSKIFDDMRKELENNPIYDDMRKELENNPIYDEMRKDIENNPIYDEMRKDIENNQKPKKTKTTAIKQAIPTILSSDKYGSKNDGIYMCKRNYCCSKYGYCGKSSAYCDSG